MLKVMRKDLWRQREGGREGVGVMRGSAEGDAE